MNTANFTFTDFQILEPAKGFVVKAHEYNYLIDLRMNITRLAHADTMTGVALSVGAIIHNLNTLDDLPGHKGKNFLQLVSDETTVVFNKRVLAIRIAGMLYAAQKQIFEKARRDDLYKETQTIAKQIEALFSAGGVPIANGWRLLNTSSEDVWLNIADQAVKHLRTLPLYFPGSKPPPSSFVLLNLVSIRTRTVSLDIGPALDEVLNAINNARIPSDQKHGDFGATRREAFLSVADTLLEKSDRWQNYEAPLTINTLVTSYIEKCLRHAGFEPGYREGWQELEKLRKNRALNFAQEQIHTAIRAGVPACLKFARQAFHLANENPADQSVFEIVLKGAEHRIAIRKTARQMLDDIQIAFRIGG